MTVVNDTDRAALMCAAEALVPQVRAYQQEMDEVRRLPHPLVRAMTEAGLFRMWLPHRYGGLEVDPETFFRVIETVSATDGSAGWTLMIGAVGGMHAAYLPESAAREIFATDRDIVTAGAYAPRGRAVPVDGGYRLTGRWAFASGSQHAAWLCAGCFVQDGNGLLIGQDGAPELRLLFMPAADCEILDTWHTAGMRGTGSLDFAAADLFVPGDRWFALFAGRPQVEGPLYCTPMITWQPCALASVALGIARTAIDALRGLAGHKVPAMRRGLLRERAVVQLQVAQAEALLRAARAFFYETVRDAWAVRLAGDELTLEQQGLLRLAAVHGAESAARAVELMYRAGGGTSVYWGSTLDRCLRDVQALLQHAGIGPQNYEFAARALLGMDPAPPTF